MALQPSHVPDVAEKLFPRHQASATLSGVKAAVSLGPKRMPSVVQLEAPFSRSIEVRGHAPASSQKLRAARSLRCSSSAERRHTEVPESNELVELPLFPLPLVLFPGATLPLQILEFRYRMMMHTLLQTDLRFGVIYSDSTAGAVDVGCVGEVMKHERLADDRFFLICKGQERFRVLNLVRTKPYLVAEVEWLEDRPSRTGPGEDLESLAAEVETYMGEVVRISGRLDGKPEKEGVKNLRRDLFPTPFSFFVGSTFEGAPREQQTLLELEDTATRLRRERDTLRNTLNYLTAASAVKDAFGSSS